MPARRFPPPWTVEELDACFVVRDHNGQQLAYVYYGNEPGRRTRMSKEGDIMKRTVCPFAVATLICAATYEMSHAAPIALLTGIQANSGNITLVYSHHYRRSHQYIVIPLTRDYGWWPQGRYRCFPLAWHAGDIGVNQPAIIA